MKEQASPRAEHEIEFGKHLAELDPVSIWGWGTPAGRLRAKRRGQLIAEGARLAPGIRTLEIGCGTGLFTEMFAETGSTIVAVDISPELIELALTRSLPPEQVQFLDKRFEDCDLDGPFDAVVGSSVLHHLEVERSLVKIIELLKPGGRLSFAEPNMLNPQVAVQKNMPIPWIRQRLGESPDETAFVRWTLRRMMQKVGFEAIEVDPYDWLHPQTPARFISAVQRLSYGLEKLPLVREFAGSLVIRGRRPGG